MRAAVIGHVEWVEFVRGDHVPIAGEIVHASDDFAEPAGGGAVAAVELARLAGKSILFTALGCDEIAERSRERLGELGVEVRAATRAGPTRRGHTFLDADGERTITTIGERLEPSADDDLGWGDLDEVDAVYVTAGDPAAIRAGRRGRVLVASPRAGAALHESGVELDALVYSDEDELERKYAAALDPRPKLMVATRGKAGGRYETADGSDGDWAAASVPGDVQDTYGCGDTFAAAFTYRLAESGDPKPELELAAKAGAECLTRRGPYGDPA